MSANILQMLKSLRDVNGVVGSFLWVKEGGMLERDLPEYLDAGMLAEVGPRVARLYEAFENAGGELDGATLVFPEHKLHLRELQAGFVAVLSSVSVNMPALRMALNLVGRRIATELQRAPAAVAQPAIATPTAAPAPAVSEPRPRFYRGQRLPT
jgi:predicted regulator of Ras-like GTPase activity (Roadblock/LC7/MglB family)